MTDYSGDIVALAMMRRHAADLNLRVRELEQKLEEQHSALYADRALAKTSLAVIEANVRDAIVQGYTLRGERPTHEALGLRLNKDYVYTVEEATRWARQWAPSMLVIDTKLFEQSGPHLPGAPIEVRDKPVATIATDLSKYLEDTNG